jgi:hypothetical protein
MPDGQYQAVIADSAYMEYFVDEAVATSPIIRPHGLGDVTG